MNSDSGIGTREDHLDRAIDRAVRDMMQLDPPAGLRRRVLSRLNRPQQRVWLLPRYLVAAGALATIVVSTTLLQQRVEPPLAPAAPHLAAASGPPLMRPPATELAESSSERDSVRAIGRPGFTRESIPMPPVKNVFGARETGVSATIDGSAHGPAKSGSIDIDAIVAPLRIVPLSARPIEIPPLVVDPRLLR